MNWLGEHGSSVMKVARAYTLTSDECQDLAQEILLQAWRSLPNFEGKASPATWFYRVALHTAMNWHRKDKPRRSRQQPLAGGASRSNRGCEQCRASSAARNRRAALQRNSPVAENRCGAGAAVPGRTELSGDGRRARHLRKQRGREAESGEKSSERTDERETTWTLTNISRPGRPSRRRRASRSMPTCCSKKCSAPNGVFERRSSAETFVKSASGC